MVWYAKVLYSAVPQVELDKFPSRCHHFGAVLSVELAVMYPTSIASISLTGATVAISEERAALNEMYVAPFNEAAPRQRSPPQNLGLPPENGLSVFRFGITAKRVPGSCKSLEGMQPDLWRGITTGCEYLFLRVKCLIPVMCAKNGVLWEHYHYVKELRNDTRAEVGGGAN
jgi:hypothetical protein